VLAKARDVIAAHASAFARAVAAGVKIAMGTDSGVGPHGSNLAELPLMAAGGMTPAQVLTSTTRSAAELMGIGDETGTIMPGKRADLVVLAGDPYELACLKANVRAVYAAGRKVR
jgi:imidazolonepropionase-like amidohydrolase